MRIHTGTPSTQTRQSDFVKCGAGRHRGPYVKVLSFESNGEHFNSFLCSGIPYVITRTRIVPYFRAVFRKRGMSRSDQRTDILQQISKIIENQSFSTHYRRK